MKFEYHVIQMAAGGRIGQFNDRITALVEEGWEPFLMSGDTSITIMMRRPVNPGTAQAPPAAQ